jgi:hypothetical protein
VERAIQHSQRARLEIIGVASSFDDIQQELINNRVDSKEKQERIEKQIVQPLSNIAEQMFPQWDPLLAALDARLQDPATDVPDAEPSVRQADAILLEMEKVLEKMLALETYNELLDIVRSLIRDQEELLERTKSQRKRQLLFP